MVSIWAIKIAEHRRISFVTEKYNTYFALSYFLAFFANHTAKFFNISYLSMDTNNNVSKF